MQMQLQDKKDQGLNTEVLSKKILNEVANSASKI